VCTLPILSKCHFKILVYSSCKNNQEATQINPCIPLNNQNIPCHSSNFAKNALSTFYYSLETQLDTLHLSLPLEWGIHKKTDAITVSHISGENPKVDKAIVVKKTHNINIFINGIMRTSNFVPQDLKDFIEFVKGINNVFGVSTLIKMFEKLTGGEKTILCA
jgi:hypothetical protein